MFSVTDGTLEALSFAYISQTKYIHYMGFIFVIIFFPLPFPVVSELCGVNYMLQLGLPEAIF